MGRCLSSSAVVIIALATALTAVAEVEVVIEDFSSPGRFGADSYRPASVRYLFSRDSAQFPIFSAHMGNNGERAATFKILRIPSYHRTTPSLFPPAERPGDGGQVELIPRHIRRCRQLQRELRHRALPERSGIYHRPDRGVRPVVRG